MGCAAQERGVVACGLKAADAALFLRFAGAMHC
jgi:hypothetical protein